MMKLKYLFDNRDLVKMLLGNWKYDDNALDMLNYYRISSNAVYPFISDGQVQLLRFAPVSEKDRNNILAELEFISYLSDNQFPALTAVLSNKGDALVTATTPWGEFHASVFNRVAGVQIGETELNENILYAFGKTLGRLHKLSANYDPKCKRWSYEDVLCWANRTLSELPNQEKAMREIDLLHSYFSKMPKTRDTYGLVHYDFELDNVFYHQETGVCSVIDFDDAMYHWYVMDIEQSLASIKEEIEPEQYEAGSELFLKGYNSEYCVSDEMLSLRPAFRRFADLYAYTRIARATAEKWDNEPKWLADLREKLDKMMKGRAVNFTE